MAFTKITYKPGDVLTAEQMNEIQTELQLHQGKLKELDAKDYILEQDTTDGGWDYIKWASGKFEAWCRYTGTTTADLDNQNRYAFDFNLPFNVWGNPLVFVSLRMVDFDTWLHCVDDINGGKWWDWYSLDEQLQAYGTSMTDLIARVNQAGGVTAAELVTALNDCNGDADAFFNELVNYADGNRGVLANITLSKEQMQKVFNATAPSVGETRGTFIVKSDNTGELTIDANIHVIGKYK